MMNRYIDRYLAHFHGTKAAIEAGYAPGSAHVMSTRNLRHPLVIAEMKRRMKAAGMEAEEVTMRLTAQARGQRPTKVVKQDGRTVETFDELGALEKVGKVHAMFVDKSVVHEIEGLEVIDDD